MERDSKTIAQHLEKLERHSRARSSFIDELRRILKSKGVCLEDDAAPYRQALDDAVRREEELDRVAVRARESVAKLTRRLDKLSEVCKLQLRQLEMIRDYLARRSDQGGEDLTPRSLGTGSRKGKRRRLFVVPGPKELQ